MASLPEPTSLNSPSSLSPPKPGGTPVGPRWELALPRGRSLPLSPSRPKILGILNLTPDSFSDGGLWNDPDRAVEHAASMLEAGADLLDLGAESTRPAGRTYGEGAATISEQEEIDRLLPVLERLRPVTDAPLSVDTRKGAVARAALDAGADLINDVTALSDEGLGRVVARAGCPVVLMHLRGTLPDVQRHARYDDVTGEVAAELRSALDRAVRLGIDRERTILDPGLGFAKLGDQSRRLLRELRRLRDLDRPLLVGASRKSFLGEVTGEPPSARLEGSLAAAAFALTGGASILRVHDVGPTRRFLDVWQAIAEASPEETA